MYTYMYPYYEVTSLTVLMYRYMYPYYEVTSLTVLMYKYPHHTLTSPTILQIWKKLGKLILTDELKNAT
jgi:hypothetical protein